MLSGGGQTPSPEAAGRSQQHPGGEGESNLLIIIHVCMYAVTLSVDYMHCT